MKLTGWKTIASEEIERNRFTRLRKDTILDERGTQKEFVVLELADGAAVLPMDPEGNVYLVKQYRCGYAGYSIEVPAGAIDAGETVEEAGRRELFEELGIEAGELVSLSSMCGLTSDLQHREHLFLALLDHVPAIHLDSDEEVIECVKVSFNEAVEMACSEKIEMGPSIAAILRAKLYLEKNN